MDKEIDKQIGVIDGEMTKEEAAVPEYTQMYQVYPNTRIAVSKHTGKLWQDRWSETEKLLQQSGVKDRWDEAIRYYQNDQGGKEGKKRRLSEVYTGRSSEPMYATENLVFGNVSALVPSVYAKNPDIEVTHLKDGQEEHAKLFERLVDTLIGMKYAPGLNAKPKMRKLVVTTMLTNIAYLELSYTKKEDGSEQLVSEIEALTKELTDAKNVSKIKEIEGKLQALDEKVSFLSSSGPKLRYRHPSMVRIDPNCEDLNDLCSADYVMIGDYVRTEFIQAMYGNKDENGVWRSIYQPTHVLPANNRNNLGHDEDINNFTLLSEGDEHTKFGYKDEREFRANCRTLVWTVWDRTTRRVLMFNDKDWSWPIWVWDDPYNLSRFFPVFPLSFYTDPTEMVARSEVMYYLDQQDEINTINNERARMRHWVMSKVFVDSNAVKDASKIMKFLQSDTEELVHAIDLPDGKRISDVLGAFPAPSTQFEGLFDTRTLFESINRMSSVTPVLQNVQFKTNTTNKAIETYESSTQMRLDEKIDAIEDLLADVGHALIEMCVQFMTADEVYALLGEAFVETNGGWQEAQDVRMFNREYQFRIVGGSTLKPTARVKKDQAMQLGQILGQFANASPMLIVIMLKMIERAFSDDVVITPEEWQMILQSTMEVVQGQSAQPQGGPEQPQAQGAQPQEQAGGPNEVMTQIEQIIMQLPDEARMALAQGIAQGIPLKQLVMQLTRQAQQPQQQPVQ